MKNMRDLHQNVVGSTHKDETKPVLIGQNATIFRHGLSTLALLV